MDYNSNRKKANKVVYISLVSVLCIFAVLIVITGINNRKSDDTKQTPTVTEPSKQETEGPSQAQMAAPKQEESTPPKANAHDAVIVPETSSAEETEALPETEDASVSAEDEESAQAVDNVPVEPLPEFTAPVDGTIAKEYADSVLVYSLTMNDYRAHTGIDFEAEVGSPVYAAADGVIGELWEEPMMGTCMSVMHTGNAVSIYKNLSNEETLEGISAGAEVKAGQVIAAVGDTAVIEQADAPHLHYELKIDGVNVDPMEYISVSDSVSYEG